MENGWRMESGDVLTLVCRCKNGPQNVDGRVCTNLFYLYQDSSQDSKMKKHGFQCTYVEDIGLNIVHLYSDSRST